MSVENNWVYYVALGVAIESLPPGEESTLLSAEQRAVRNWLQANMSNRGLREEPDRVKALDVYTHALLAGPAAHLDFGIEPPAVAEWARAHIGELERLFQLAGTPAFDYTDAAERKRIGREPAAWLEGTEQVVVAYETWAAWFERYGDLVFAQELRMKAQLAHTYVTGYALRSDGWLAIPNTNAAESFLAFEDGWPTRPKSEPALNSTNWAYFAETRYNPFTTPILPHRR